MDATLYNVQETSICFRILSPFVIVYKNVGLDKRCFLYALRVFFSL